MKMTRSDPVGRPTSSRLPGLLMGVGVTITTPFSRDGRRPDLDGLRSNVSWLVSAGIELIYPCGNTGEFAALSLDEWSAVVETTIDAGGGVAVVPGIGGAFRTASEMVERATSLGADGILLMPLNYPYASESGAVEYYSALTANPSLPGVLYRRGDQLSASALQLILARGCIAGVKFASHDMTELATLIRATPSEVIWGCGLAETWAPFYALAGARGFTSGLANFAPQVALSMVESLKRNDLRDAFACSDEVMQFEKLRTRDFDRFNVAAVKYAMDLAGLAGGPVRAPLSKLDGGARAEVREAVKAWQR